MAVRQSWTELRPHAGLVQGSFLPHRAPSSHAGAAELPAGTVLSVVPPMPVDAGKVCFLVTGVMSEAECEGLRGRCEAEGWHQATLEYGLGSGEMAGESVVDVSLRDSDRCILHDESLAGRIWERVRPLLPLDAFEPLQPVRVNPCFRCLRYKEGQAGFAKHVDGRTVVEGAISRVTIQLYLNDGFDGGATRLCHADDTEDAARGVDVVPRRGMALVFDQSILHKGSPVRRGIKHTARTEVMYS